MQRRTKILAAVGGAVVVLGAVSSFLGDDPTPAAADATASHAAPSTKSDACLDVPADLMTRIADGGKDGQAFTAKEGAAVRGTGGETYFVALRFGAAGVPDQVGVWGTTALEGSTGIISVDGLAKNFTVWPDAEKAFNVSPAHPSVDAAKGCLG